MGLSNTITFQRGTFVTRLPVSHRYSPSHGWLADAGNGRWRVGFTKFALRMLGELVDVQFEREPGGVIRPGDILGSIEGFKAVSDLYCLGRGTFVGGNSSLASDLEVIGRDPYGAGWLYEFEGEPDTACFGVVEYRDLLAATIDRMLAQQKPDETAG